MTNKNTCKTLMLLPFLLLASCQSQDTLAQLFIYDSTDTFIGSLRVALEKNLEDYLPFSDHFAERKQTTQNEQTIDALNDSRTKILVMNTVDRLASSALIEKAQKKNVPIVFFNREPLADDFASDWASRNCYYVGSDPAVEGRFQAEIADSIFGGSSSFSSKTNVYDKNHDGVVDLVILKGEQGHQDTEQRSEYCISKLTDLGYTVNILSSAYCNWERDVAKETMKTLYSQNIDLLFSNNDDMALGAIDYLKEIEGTPTDSSLLSSSAETLPFAERFFPIVGVDDTAAGQAAIDEGTLSGTVLNNASKQARVIFDLMQHALDGKAIPDYPTSEVVPSGNYYHVLGEIIRKKS